jgi:hypothetical protein
MITPMSRAAAAQLETSIGDALYKCAGNGMFRRAVSVILDYISAGLCVDLLADLEDLIAGELEEGRNITAAELDEEAHAERCTTVDEINATYGPKDGKKVHRP